MDSVQSFTAEVRIAGINPYVNVSPGIVKELGGESKIPVLVRVGRKSFKDSERLKAIGRLTEDGWFRTTVLRMRSNPHRLYLDTWMRDTASMKVGDRVRIKLKRDPASRDLSMPHEMKKALEGNHRAKAEWESLSPSRRREILTYLNFLKTPAARIRNVEKTIDRLASKEV